MLTAIELENFKGVGRPVRIELCPITLLFGPNSAGKSTLIQALLYAREVLERGNVDADRTIAGGDAVDLGGFVALAHGRSREKKIRLRLDFTNDLAGFPDRMLYSGSNYVTISEGYHDGLESQFERCWVQIVVAWSEQFDHAFVEQFEVGADGRPIGRIVSSSDGREMRIEGLELRHPLVTYDGRPIIIDGYSPYELPNADGAFGRTSTRCGTGTRGALPRWDAELEIIRPSEEEIRDRARARFPQVREIFQRAVEDISGPEVAVAPAAKDQAAQPPDAGSADQSREEADLEATLEADFVQSAVDLHEALWSPALEERLSLLFVGIGRLALEELRGIRYLGPVREVPSRGHQAPRTPQEGRWSGGLAAWDALIGGDLPFQEKIGEWLERLGTGYGVRIKHWRELPMDGLLMRVLGDPDFPRESLLDLIEDIRADLISSPDGKKVLLAATASELLLEPQDVGVGLSQVVPVVVAALARPPTGRAPFVAIEQPELHVHPAIQVELGDLFASAIGPDAPTFLLETHSEHLMLRLLRRIQETRSGELPPGKPALHPDQVSVIFIEQIEGQMRATRLRVDETGEFIDRWPRGFFEERAEELF